MRIDFATTIPSVWRLRHAEVKKVAQRHPVGPEPGQFVSPPFTLYSFYIGFKLPYILSESAVDASGTKPRAISSSKTPVGRVFISGCKS